MKAVTLAVTLCSQHGTVDLEKLQEMLQKLNFIVQLIAEPKDSRRHSSESFVHVRHSFLMCFGATAGGMCGDLPITTTMPIIVDPCFKAQFDIQNPSNTYSAMMESVPQVYTGTCDELRALVRIMCREMQQSFEETQCALPPWRTLKSMLSRWMIPLREVLPNEDFDKQGDVVGSL